MIGLPELIHSGHRSTGGLLSDIIGIRDCDYEEYFVLIRNSRSERCDDRTMPPGLGVDGLLLTNSTGGRRNPLARRFNSRRPGSFRLVSRDTCSPLRGADQRQPLAFTVAIPIVWLLLVVAFGGFLSQLDAQVLVWKEKPALLF